MRFNCLLLSRDPEMPRAVEQVFGGIDLQVNENITSGFELPNRSHFDAFIVDCDGMEYGTEIIAGIRSSRANRKSVIFTIVNGKTSVATAMELGSNFVLGKPVEVGRLKAYFHSSLHKMESEHRRYFRYQVTVDAEVVGRDGRAIAAQILNVSNGGLTLRLLEQAHLDGSVTIRFHCPNYRIIQREAGLGSLGQQRFVVIALLSWRIYSEGTETGGSFRQCLAAWSNCLSSVPLPRSDELGYTVALSLSTDIQVLAPPASLARLKSHRNRGVVRQT